MEQKGFGVREMKLLLRPLGGFRIYECRRGSKSSFFEREETLEASPAVCKPALRAWRVVGGWDEDCRALSESGRQAARWDHRFLAEVSMILMPLRCGSAHVAWPRRTTAAG